MVTLPPNPALTGFIKPGLDTPFHIDFSWFEKQGLDINVELLSHLCAEHRNAYHGQSLAEKIDWIDWMTGEVKQVEGLHYIISRHCSKQPGYVREASTLVASVFRVFLSNSNQPQTPRQLAPLVNYPETQILRVLSGRLVSKGLRPVLPD
jgi:hypothetical protein